MSRKKYSSDDVAKIKRDLLEDLRAKGADAQAVDIVHPGGDLEGVRQLRSEMSSVIDQSQSQSQANRRTGFRRTESGRRE